jgi:hypothetical protein
MHDLEKEVAITGLVWLPYMLGDNGRLKPAW